MNGINYIGRSARVRQGYSRPIDLSMSKSFQQMLQAGSRDSNISSVSARPPKTGETFAAKETFDTGETFSAEERRYGCVTVSNATHAKLKKLREINERADYTGMSPEEIYKTIWDRYNEAFDGNMMAITACIAGPAEWGPVNNQFYYEIRDQIIHPAMRAAREADPALTYEECRDIGGKVSGEAYLKTMGWDGMSYEEREASIKEKYAGKNTTRDFLMMQSELYKSGVLEYRMGSHASFYCAVLGNQFDQAFNPNSIYAVGYENSDFMTADQWYRVADQPFDAVRMARAMKDNIDRVSGDNGFSEDIRQLFFDYIDHFITEMMGDSIDRLINETLSYRPV